VTRFGNAGLPNRPAGGRLSHRDRFQAHPLPSSRAEKLVYATVTIAAMVAAALAAGSNTGM